MWNDYHHCTTATQGASASSRNAKQPSRRRRCRCNGHRCKQWLDGIHWWFWGMTMVIFTGWSSSTDFYQEGHGWYLIMRPLSPPQKNTSKSRLMMKIWRFFLHGVLLGRQARKRKGRAAGRGLRIAAPSNQNASCAAPWWAVQLHRGWVQMEINQWINHIKPW